MDDAEKKALTAEEEHALWKEFVRKRDTESRVKLIDHHYPLARKIAAKLFALRTDETLEFPDFMQYASLGLLESIDRYDPSRNATFNTYASYRIQGAILNGIEKTSEKLAQRSYRKRLQKERLESLGKGVKTSQSEDLFAEMADVAIGLAIGYMLEDSGLYRKDEVAQEDDPYRCYELKRIQERLQIVVEALPEREKFIVEYHYVRYVSFEEISELLGLSKGRISQIHRRALILLRQAYNELSKFDVTF